jgi:nucleoside-diphosphate-sugar epimerase
VTRVLVLGGTRFLGPPTVRWLLDAGHEVKVFHRGDTEPLDGLEDLDLDPIFQQMPDPESVRMAAFTAEDQTDRRAFLNRMSGRHKRLAPSHRGRRSNRWNDRVLPDRQSG